MRFILAAALAMLFASPAFAWNPPLPGEPGYVAPPPSASNTAAAASTARAKAKAHASASANNSGSIKGGNVRVESSAQAPALGGLSSGYCAGTSGGVSVGVPAVGVGIQGGNVDPQCTLRANIETMRWLGANRIAQQMAAHLDGVAEAVAELCKEPRDAEAKRICRR